jgi:hypothetical protein
MRKSSGVGIAMSSGFRGVWGILARLTLKRQNVTQFTFFLQINLKNGCNL